jgi:hypothetical protein
LHIKDNLDKDLILINVLEFVTVIFNYCAMLQVLAMTNITKDPHPVVLNITDNKLALCWTNHTCKESQIGRLLARVFCSFLINFPVGITSKWISTDKNYIADNILRQKRTSLSSFDSFDYSFLQQKYPKLKACSFFQINNGIALLIWETVLIESWSSHDTIQTLKCKPLGRLTTSSGALP